MESVRIASKSFVPASETSVRARIDDPACTAPKRHQTKQNENKTDQHPREQQRNETAVKMKTKMKCLGVSPCTSPRPRRRSEPEMSSSRSARGHWITSPLSLPSPRMCLRWTTTNEMHKRRRVMYGFAYIYYTILYLL